MTTNKNNMKKVYLLLADGFETIEALSPVDIFRRAGVDIKTVSISNSLTVTSSHKITVKADLLVGESMLDDGDMIVLPGGYPGYENLGKSADVGALVKKYYKEGKYVAAICGAPTVLAKYGVAEGSRITCHHTAIEEMKAYQYVGGSVVVDGNLITADGAGHSIDFGLALARVLCDEAAVNKVMKGMELI